MANVRVDIAAAVSGLQRVRVDQIPFATAKALTNTAQAAMTAVRAKLPSQFRLRNVWTAQGVRFQMATRSNPVAAVTFDRYYMYLQEVGGVKIGKRTMIAIPLDPALRRRIPSNMRPRVLLGQSDIGSMLASIKSQSRRNSITRTYNTGFLINSKGKVYIAIRTGRSMRKGMLRGQYDPNLRILYILVPSAQIPQRLHMYETVRTAAAEQFRPLFAEAMAYAISTAR
jgi:hypothetical protein